MAHFIEEQLAKDFQTRPQQVISQDLTLLCGDFNTRKYPAGEIQLKYLFGSDKEWAYCIGHADQEYSRMVQSLQLDNTLEVTDVWDEQKHGETYVTYADIKVDDKGNKAPAETVLTMPFENCFELCLDYIFRIRPNFG
jgi:hypothetical protein